MLVTAIKGMLKGRCSACLSAAILMLLVVVVAVSFWFLEQQPTISQAAQQSAPDIAAETVAYYAKVLAWFTAVLAAVSFAQGYLLKRLIELTRNEFSASYPPELVMRDVRWDSIEKGEEAIAFTLVNKGRSPCRIVESIFRFRPSLNMTETFDTAGANDLGPLTLKAGEFRFLTSRMISEGEKLAAEAAKRVIFADHYFRGVIIYEDDRGVRRRWVILRKCEEGTMHFVPLGDSNSEYTD
jgi:hypothetical protein